MSREDVQSFKRAVEAYNRRDVQAVLDELDPEVEWHPGLWPGLPALLGGEAAVGRGHEGARKLLGDVYDAFAELHLELSEVRDLGADVLAIGRLYLQGRESGVEAELPWAYVVEYRNGKALVIHTYLDPEKALEAAGLSE